MYQTTYHRAASVAEALSLVAGADDGKFVSGGMTLIPAMKQRLAAPSDLVDLRHIAELKGVRVSGRDVSIGAGTTHFEIANDAALKALCPAFAGLAGHIGDPHVRYMGTIGGSVANSDPAADYPAALLAMAATIVTNKREIAAADFFTGLFETALEDHEMVTEIRFTAPAQAGYMKFPNPASRYAMAGVFVARDEDGVRVGVTGAGDNGVFRAETLEAALSRNFSPSALEGMTFPSDSMMGDIHASPAYRANLVVVMAKRAVAAAIG